MFNTFINDVEYQRLVLNDAVPDENQRKLLIAFLYLTLTYDYEVADISSKVGIMPSDFSAIFAVGAQGKTPKQLSRLLRLTPSAMTSVIDRLERQGYVFRESNPDDRRSILVRPTLKAFDLVRDAAARLAKVFSAEMSEDDIAAIVKIIHRFIPEEITI